MTILVCPLAEVDGALRLHRPRHVVSLLSPETAAFPDFANLDIRALRLACHDIVEPMEGLTPPSAEQIDQLLAFLGKWKPDEPLLIHCWAGISRSTAAAYIAACYRSGPGHEESLAKELRRVAPFATPNPLIVKLGDRALGRGGSMEDSISRIGRGEPATGRLIRLRHR